MSVPSWRIVIPPLLAAGFLGCHDSGKGQSVFVTQPGFTVTAASSGLRIVAGGSGYVQVSLSRLNGFTGAVDLSLSGAPSGVNAQARIEAGATSVALPVSIGSEVSVQTVEQSQIVGTSGSQSVSTPFRIEVLAALPTGSYTPQQVIATGGLQTVSGVTNQAVAQEITASVQSTNGTTTQRSGFHPAGNLNQ